MDTGGANAVISTDPSFDVTAFFAGDQVTDQLIALWFSAISAGPFRVFDFPAAKGESIFFSADNTALFSLLWS